MPVVLQDLRYGPFATFAQAMRSTAPTTTVRSARTAQASSVESLRPGARPRALELAYHHEVSPGDPSTYAAVVLVLSVVSIGAVYWPIRHATHIDPLRALKVD